MTALSKYYNDLLITNKVSCAYVMHPDSSCAYFLLENVPIIAFRTAEFFFPLYFLPLLAHPQNITKEKLLDVCRTLASSVQMGLTTALSIFAMICLASKLNGNISYWTLLPISSLVGGSTIYFATKKVQSLFGHATSIVIFEMLLRDGSIWPLKIINQSRMMRTLLFMGLSGIIIDSLYLNKDTTFWLFQPLLKRLKAQDNQKNVQSNQNPNQVCHHRKSCEHHWSKVFKKYLLLGLALEAAKAFFGNFGIICKNPISGLHQSIANINTNFLIFICGYPTMTNMTNCLLNHWTQESTRFNQNAAAVIGGLPFWFYANQTPILMHTLTTAIEMLFSRYKRYCESDSKTYKIATNLPYAKLIYIFGGAFMYTSRIFYPWLAPKFLCRLITLMLNHKVEDIGNRIHSMWMPELIV